DVTAPSPVATFEVFGAGGLLAQSVKPGEEVTFDGSASSDPTGECTPSAGCVPTSHLKSYTWNFGDGSQAVTSTEPKVKHVFANAGLQEVSDTVSLTVTNEEGVESTPNVQAVTVLGTQEEVKQTPAKEVFKEAPKEVFKEAPKEAVKESPPGKSQVVPPPSRKPLTTAQKLALALKACKKYKSKKARAVCERAAHKKYAPPKKHTKKKKKKG
ncbi:MAG TPA: PKD domain-containing protein, partial [Solirubrobacteraceae bacterium]|nr:PKD domain-containing protein [Solirubrobacteraceae bacterium]